MKIILIGIIASITVNSLKTLINWAIKPLQEAQFVVMIPSAFVDAH
jgi:hypothetical protein